MTADAALGGLLALQEHDLTRQQLRHRRATLPERQELAAAEEALADLRRRHDEVGTRIVALADRQAALESEIAELEERVAASDRALGAVTTQRQAEALEAELASHRGRISDLEDQALETMEEREDAESERDALASERASAQADIERMGALVTEIDAAIEAELAAADEARAEAAAVVGGELLATYERLRDDLGGIGVAQLVDGRCSGCHLALPATEVAALRKAPVGAVVQHEECGRILVRPAPVGGTASGGDPDG